MTNALAPRGVRRGMGLVIVLVWAGWAVAVLVAPILRHAERLTQLMMGDKSERAQKVFALDYCASAFVTEGAPSTTPPAVPRACRVRRDGEPWRSANQASGRGCARRTREVRVPIGRSASGALSGISMPRL